MWPSMPVRDWQDTRDTLQLWTQVVGKVKLAHSPAVNHWWNATLYVTARGLTTSLIPYQDRGFQIDFDLRDHRLDILVTDGSRASLPLEPRPVAAFYDGVMGRLDDLGLHTDIWPMPVEIDDAVRFDKDVEHSTYDPEQAHRFWLLLVNVDRVFWQFRARFLGKASPVHLFWGALDLATTRFSGRPAPPYQGSAANCGPHVMLEAYSHEVSSCGYWPGGDGEGFFYSYAYPEPPGFRDARVTPPTAKFDAALGEYVLPYETVRAAADPDAMLLEFLQTTYEAAAKCAAWDRESLERHG